MEQARGSLERTPIPGGPRKISREKADSIREAIAARGCELLFLPSYSPDCTPIAQALSKIKAFLRGVGVRIREALVEAIGLAVATITREDVVAWSAHPGYALPSQAS